MSKLVKSVSAEERKFLRKAFWRSATLYAAVSPVSYTHLDVYKRQFL